MFRISVTLFVFSVTFTNFIGCATVMRGTDQDISVSSETSNAVCSFLTHGLFVLLFQLKGENHEHTN